MAKKKKKAKSPRTPRTAPRGMYLSVHCMDRGDLDETVRISSFNDITALGHKIARAVRSYLRTVPMLPHVPAYSLQVWPRWTPTSSAPARKAQSADHDGRLDLDDGDGGSV